MRGADRDPQLPERPGDDAAAGLDPPSVRHGLDILQARHQNGMPGPTQMGRGTSYEMQSFGAGAGLGATVGPGEGALAGSLSVRGPQRAASTADRAGVGAVFDIPRHTSSRARKGPETALKPNLQAMGTALEAAVTAPPEGMHFRAPGEAGGGDPAIPI